MRKLSYAQALSEGLTQAMEVDSRVFVMGEGVDDPKAVFGTTKAALEKFGADRVFDTPLSEAAMTGMGIGAAIQGLPNVMIHMRSEFLLYAMDQVVNHAAKWRYMSGGLLNVPIVIRSLIGRGWGQAAQHSQSLQAIFAGFPGLKVIMPSTPYDAKGLLYQAILDPNPILMFEHRWLYDKVGEVPEEAYSVEIGKANVLRSGRDITLLGVSYQVLECLAAADFLSEKGISAEVIDLRTISPLDLSTIIQSVRKTGRLVICDTASRSFGVAAEIIASVQTEIFSTLKGPMKRVALPDFPTPCSSALEEAYYPSVKNIVEEALSLFENKNSVEVKEKAKDFFGPF